MEVELTNMVISNTESVSHEALGVSPIEVARRPLSFQLFTEPKTLPKNANRIEGNNFDGPVKLSGH
jgi:hypothetical protein